MAEVVVAPLDSGVLLPALARQPGHLLWRAHGRVVLLAARTLPADMDLLGYAVLVALGDGEPRSQQALADLVATSRTTLAKLAAELVAQGLVERVRNPEDRRSYALTRTAAGARAAGRWRGHAARLEQAVTAPLDPEEVAELRRLLRVVVEPDLPPGTPGLLRDGLPFLLARAKGRLHNRFAELLAPLDLDPRHFGSLTALAALGPVPQAELARAVGVSGASTVQIVDELESRGLLERRRLPSDRRTQVLHLLPASERMLHEAGELARALVADQLASLSRAQVQRLSRLLARLVTAD